MQLNQRFHMLTQILSMHVLSCHITVLGYEDRHNCAGLCLQHVKMQAASEHAYLALRPDSPSRTSDVLLKLDDGTTLPVHSRVLAQYSPVFRDMFDLGDDEPLPAATPATREELPFTDCPREVAIGFLSILYSALCMSEANLLSNELLLSIARLGDKFDMKVGTGDVSLCYTV